MKKSLLFLLIVSFIFIGGCAPAEVPSPEEIPLSEPESTVALENESSPSQQEVTETIVQASAENNQPEEKVELTFAMQIRIYFSPLKTEL